VHGDPPGNPYQVSGRNTPIPPSLRPGPPQGNPRRKSVSFASPVQSLNEASHTQRASAVQLHNEALHTQSARSASTANAELQLPQPIPSYASQPRLPARPPSTNIHQQGYPSPHLPARPPPSTTHQQGPPGPQEASPPQRPDFLIIGLFALRLAKKLIRSLDKYPERDDDLAWITHFLRPYTRRDALARISGARIDEYVGQYPVIVARFIRQPGYPVVFTQLNPDRRITDRKLSDQECIDIVDFADAAGEWGSTVKLPGMEAERIERLSERRRVAHF
jgi:hypothetical protein